MDLSETPKDALDALKLIRWKRLSEVIGISKSRIRQLEQAGEFPQRIAISSQAVGWRYFEVLAWLKKRENGKGAMDRSANLRANATKGAKRPKGPARRKTERTTGAKKAQVR